MSATHLIAVALTAALLSAGFVLALATNGHLAAALILPLYYLADATLSLLRRIVRGEPFWLAHRTHFYQRATDGGYSMAQIVERVSAVNLCLVALAAATIAWPNGPSTVAAVTCAIVLTAWLLYRFAEGKA